MPHNKNILISPYSNILPNGQESPKNWSKENWIELVNKIKENSDYNILQIGTFQEEQIKGTDIIFRNRPFEEVKKLIQNSRVILSVDNFLPHFCKTFNKKCIVIWGPSNPKIFGYKENINLQGDSKYMRRDQFWKWDQCESIDLRVFPSVEQVYNEIIKFL